METQSLNLTFGEFHPKNPGARKLQEMEEEIDSFFPEYKGYQKDGYTIIGKVTKGKNRFLVEDVNGDYFFTVVTNEDRTNRFDDITTAGAIEVEIVKMGNIQYDPNIFIPMKSGTALDYVFSKKGGIMPATNFIIIGDPGIGKSTLSIELAAQMQKENPDRDILFISGEMTRIDMFEYIERFPEWKNLNTVFVSEFQEGRYKETMEHILDQGWDFVVGDSFAEISDAVREDFNMFTRGKMSSSGAEKWLIDLMVKNNLGENQKCKHTAHLIIQQVTKGGQFVGSNKLKHNTTGMIELRYTSSGERRIDVTKNRRGFEYDGLIFDLPESGGITFDIARIEREKELQSKINAERDQLLSDEKRLNTLFGFDEKTEADFSVAEIAG